MTPGDRLRAARLNAGFRSVAKASATLGMSESSYRAHENGQNDFTPAQAQAYADAFGVDPAWLVFGGSESGSMQRLVQLLIRKGVITDEEAMKL